MTGNPTTQGPSLRRKRVRAVITGIAFFFPGFIFSLPVTCTWANHHWAGEAQASLGAIGPSFVIGVLAAIACTIYLLMKVNLESGRNKD
jgi:purine-cytosine permease-like protein